MEAEALNWGSMPSTTYTPESATVTALSVRAPLRMSTDALPLWPGKTACWSSSQATMRDSPTAQLPLLSVVGGNRDSVTVSPTTVVLTDGRTSTEAETRRPREEGSVCYLESWKTVLLVLLCLNPQQNLLSINSSNPTEISPLFFIMYRGSVDV